MKREPVWLKVIRILLGCLFLFSSFSKAVDPVNFGITMNDYFVSFGMGFLHPIALVAAVCAIAAEFVLGCMMLLRVRPKLAAWGYLIFMTFFFFLTLWLAVAEYMEIHGIHYFGVVHDCGCFGQVVKMSNLTTFIKNVIIIIPTIILFVHRKRIPDIRLTVLGQWICIVIFTLIAVLFQLHCIRHLPLIDFSDWKKGNDVVKIYIGEPGKKESVYVYKNNSTGEEITLSEDELMEQMPDFYDNNTYVDRQDKEIVAAVKPEIDGFAMMDENGADYRSRYFNYENENDMFVLFMHDLGETNEKGLEKAKVLAADCAAHDVVFVAVTNSSQEEIAQFVAEHNLEFPIYSNPIDPAHGPFMVRDAVRSNPGLIKVHKGIVMDKWAWRDFPGQYE